VLSSSLKKRNKRERPCELSFNRRQVLIFRELKEDQGWKQIGIGLVAARDVRQLGPGINDFPAIEYVCLQ
jgi:hypothetical protein